MKKQKRKNPVPYPYSKWITAAGWKKISKSDRKIITDLVKLQNKVHKKYPNDFVSDEEYVNMNAEIDYLKSIGQH